MVPSITSLRRSCRFTIHALCAPRAFSGIRNGLARGDLSWRRLLVGGGCHSVRCPLHASCGDLARYLGLLTGAHTRRRSPSAQLSVLPASPRCQAPSYHGTRGFGTLGHPRTGVRQRFSPRCRMSMSTESPAGRRLCATLEMATPAPRFHRRRRVGRCERCRAGHPPAGKMVSVALSRWLRTDGHAAGTSRMSAWRTPPGEPCCVFCRCRRRGGAPCPGLPRAIELSMPGIVQARRLATKAISMTIVIMATHRSTWRSSRNSPPSPTLRRR